MNYNLTKMQKTLFHYLDKERMEHTIGVRYICASLAMCYGYDLDKAQLAGLLHDCAKCIPAGEKIKLCNKHHLEISEPERKSPFLLHAKLGTWIAKEKYQVTDDEILNAIRYHTTGRVEMTQLEKIVYIADFIEPGRGAAPNLTRIRTLAFQDIDETMYVILKSTLQYLTRAERNIDPMTETAYEYYKKLHQSKKEGLKL